MTRVEAVLTAGYGLGVAYFVVLSLRQKVEDAIVIELGMTRGAAAAWLTLFIVGWPFWLVAFEILAVIRMIRKR